MNKLDEARYKFDRSLLRLQRAQEALDEAEEKAAIAEQEYTAEELKEGVHNEDSR